MRSIVQTQWERKWTDLYLFILVQACEYYGNKTFRDIIAVIVLC